MPSKRTRAAFEEDLQAQQSPFVFFGTALPPIDPSIRDDGSYVPVWKQTVTDDQGRRRLHGAFTGGFSAGYFNTVGSKEGWTPSNFVSSRQKRLSEVTPTAAQRPEDFMDEEDLADAADAERIHTTKSFSSIGAMPDDQAKLNLARSSEDTIGARLLQKMGWRKGQGIGPKVRRRADLGVEDESVRAGDPTSESHLFAPTNSPLVLIVKKDDHKGLGFGTQREKATDTPNDDSDLTGWHGLRTSSDSNLKKKQNRAHTKKSGFGIGVLNDTGSDDDDDPYSMGPRISFSSVSSRDSKSKKADIKKPAALSNPRLSSRPLLVSKKKIDHQKATAPQKCHDGKPPLRRFQLSKPIAQLSKQIFQVPRIPEGWVSKLSAQTRDRVTNLVVGKATADQATLDPVSRARILGEIPLQGKSVFDFMSAENRNRIATASGKSDLPPGRGENVSKGGERFSRSVEGHSPRAVPRLSDLIRPPPIEAAEAALKRLSVGWTPYAADQGKAHRYHEFLEVCTGLKDGLPIQPKEMVKKEWINEMEEFAHAARVFKPVTGMMASRFAPASSLSASNALGSANAAESLTKSSGAQDAAEAGMFGPLTRSVHPFYPPKLLCKRFGVPPPSLVPESKTSEHATTSAPSNGMNIQRPAPFQGDMTRPVKTPGNSTSGFAPPVPVLPLEPQAVDAESNDALEAERVGEDIFDSIFNSG